MKAVWLEEFGGPEVLVAADASDPVPGPGQALIEVSFANITFVETMFRASGFGPFETELPMIPGNGIGGVVASVGLETEERLAVRAATSENPLSGCSTVVAEWSVSLTQPSSLAPPWARHCSLPDQRRYCTRLARFTRKENNEDNRC
jgi:NADPH2:quinone reductase